MAIIVKVLRVTKDIQVSVRKGHAMAVGIVTIVGDGCGEGNSALSYSLLALSLTPDERADLIRIAIEESR